MKVALGVTGGIAAYKALELIRRAKAHGIPVTCDTAPPYFDLNETAIGDWRTVGCVKGKGRTQLWLLAKRLAEAACGDAEMQDVFYKQAAHATNPEERRSEIDPARLLGFYDSGIV